MCDCRLSLSGGGVGLRPFLDLLSPLSPSTQSPPEKRQIDLPLRVRSSRLVLHVSFLFVSFPLSPHFSPSAFLKSDAIRQLNARPTLPRGSLRRPPPAIPIPPRPYIDTPARHIKVPSSLSVHTSPLSSFSAFRFASSSLVSFPHPSVEPPGFNDCWAAFHSSWVSVHQRTDTLR